MERLPENDTEFAIFQNNIKEDLDKGFSFYFRRKIIEKGNELGEKLFTNGYGNDATQVLRVNLCSQDDEELKTLNDLAPSQIDLAKVVVMKLEELVQGYNL